MPIIVIRIIVIIVMGSRQVVGETAPRKASRGRPRAPPGGAQALNVPASCTIHMYVCIYVYIYIYICTCMYIYIFFF